MRYWEDFKVGQVFQLGTTRVTADEIVEFGRRWAPQPFHIDFRAAEASSFGGLCASGWHIVLLFMRLYIDNLLVDTASQGSPGAEDVRWLVPVRPGDTLTATAVVEQTHPSAKRRDRGTVVLRWEMRNADNTVVLRMRCHNLFTRRT